MAELTYRDAVIRGIAQEMTRDPDVVFLGEDETRPMGERVRRFLDRYGGETFHVDGRDFALPGVEPAVLK